MEFQERFLLDTCRNNRGKGCYSWICYFSLGIFFGTYMWNFILRNIGQRLFLLVIVSFVAHSFIHLAPGEPSEVDPMNPRMKPEDIAKIRAAFHLDDPLHVQYAY
ncbi:MAG: hypothetical protein OET79_05180, partial [Nitrospirota bacterium]|nr:hypothetical protein [Nitrospirota bacterium]